MYLTDTTTSFGSFLVWYLSVAMVVLGGVFMSALVYFYCIMQESYHWAAPLERNKLEFV